MGIYLLYKRGAEVAMQRCQIMARGMLPGHFLHSCETRPALLHGCHVPAITSLL